jgi:hypothetical protein
VTTSLLENAVILETNKTRRPPSVGVPSTYLIHSHAPCLSGRRPSSAVHHFGGLPLHCQVCLGRGKREERRKRGGEAARGKGERRRRGGERREKGRRREREGEVCVCLSVSVCCCDTLTMERRSFDALSTCTRSLHVSIHVGMCTCTCDMYMGTWYVYIVCIHASIDNRDKLQCVSNVYPTCN